MRTRRLVMLPVAGSIAALILFAGAAIGGGGTPAKDDHAPRPAPRAPGAKPAAPSRSASPVGETRKPSEQHDTAHHDEPAADHAEDAHPSDVPALDPHESDAHAPDAEPPVAPEPAAPPADAESALKLLREGNARWVSARPQNPNSDPSRRELLASEGQHPFVTILTCADSRLPVERIFDRGVGEVFVVRVAGNVAGECEVATVEYGVEHLHTPLLIVMGHSKCGAVAAAASDAEVHGAVARLVGEIAPAVERARRHHPELSPDQLVPYAVKENVWQSVFDLLSASTVIREHVKSGALRIEGAVCDIATGEVEWLGEHPWQSQLIDALNTSAASPAHAEAPTANDDH